MGDLPYDPSYPGPTNPKEFGSGYPTRHGFGIGGNIAGNLTGIPGAGMAGGWLAQWLVGLLQNSQARNAVNNATSAYQTPPDQGGDTTVTVGDPEDATGTAPSAPATTTTPSAGVGIDPMGMPADPGEWWSNDFGRWGGGDQYGTTPGNYVNRAGPGGAFGSRGVWGGQTTIPGGNDQNFMPSLGWAMPAASGGGAYGGNTMAKIALHSGTFRNAATPEQWNFMQNYLSGGGGGGGGGQGVGGAGRPMTQSRQKGDSDVGLKLFKTHQRLQGGSSAVRFEGDRAIHNVPTNEDLIPDDSVYRTAPYERELIQEQDRWTDPKTYDAEQKDTWQRSFDSDPAWRLLKGYGNSWMYAPDEPTSEEYRQAKNLEEELYDSVYPKIRKGPGVFNPKFVPMRGGPYGDPSEWDQLRRFDPDRSQETIMAQGGENDVRGKEPPFAEGGKWWWERADEQAKLDDEQGHGPEFAGSETPEQMLDRRRRTSYKTIGVQINGQEVEIPIWDENMTPEQAEGFARDRLEMGLSPFASDMELEAAQNKRRGYAMGTSSVNPGLKLFHAQLKRKKQ